MDYDVSRPNKPKGPFISEHRKVFLDLKDDLNLIEALKAMPSSKRRDILLAEIQSSFGMIAEESEFFQLKDKITASKIELNTLNETLQSLKDQIEDISILVEIRRILRDDYEKNPKKWKYFISWKRLVQLINS